jgi:hypothetical protein
MDTKTTNLDAVKGNRTEMARKCLELIRDIAERGALSWNPQHVGYALQELSQVLLERRVDDIRFEPVEPDLIPDLSSLYVELQWVDGFLQDMTRSACN